MRNNISLWIIYWWYINRITSQKKTPLKTQKNLRKTQEETRRVIFQLQRIHRLHIFPSENNREITNYNYIWCFYMEWTHQSDGYKICSDWLIFWIIARLLPIVLDSPLGINRFVTKFSPKFIFFFPSILLIYSAIWNICSLSLWYSTEKAFHISLPYQRNRLCQTPIALFIFPSCLFIFPAMPLSKLKEVPNVSWNSSHRCIGFLSLALMLTKTFTFLSRFYIIILYL